MSATPPRPGATSAPRGVSVRGRRWLAVPTLGGACLLLNAIALVIYLLVQGSPLGGSRNSGMSAEVTKLPPIPSIAPDEVAPGSIEGCETTISSGVAETTASPPVTLTVGTGALPVVPVGMFEGEWEFPENRAGAAAWLCGTVVNYVMEVQPTEENAALLGDLSPGDPMTVILASGTELLFRFAERREAGPGDASVLAQTQPRLTVVSRGQGGVWQVSVADYVAEREPERPPVTALAKIEEPVRVDDLLVLVTEGHVAPTETDVEAGMMVYMVEYAIENVGTDPVRTDWVSTQLQDGAGNRYLMSPAASALGTFGPLLGGELKPGTIVRASAGYIVPVKLAGPALIWTFWPHTGSSSRANVIIPHETTGRPISPDQYSVAITDVFLNLRGDVLHIQGEIRNTGENPLTVGLSDITLTSSAGLSDLLLAAPPLPWTVQPGQTQVIELQYSTPAASAALLTILGYSFEIQGLR